jgi:hypothetical protein
MQDVRSVSHELGIVGRAVNALPILDWALKHIAKFSLCAQIVGPHEVNHAPVLQQIVLQGVAGQHHPALCLHAFEGVRNGGVTVFDSVSLVADHQVRTRLYERVVNFCKVKIWISWVTAREMVSLPLQRAFFLLSSSSTSIKLTNFFFLLSLSRRKLKSRYNSYPIRSTPPLCLQFRIT